MVLLLWNDALRPWNLRLVGRYVIEFWSGDLGELRRGHVSRSVRSLPLAIDGVERVGPGYEINDRKGFIFEITARETGAGHSRIRKQ